MDKILLDKQILLDRIAELEEEKDNNNLASIVPRVFELKSILQQGEEYNEKYPDLPKDYKEITGWNNPDEQAAYDLGREHEQKVILNFIKNWKGDTNSVFGQLMKEKCEEYNENEATEFAEWTHTSKTAINYKDNLIFGDIDYNKMSKELFKLYKDERKEKLK